VEAQLFHTDRHTGMLKLIFDFRNFANALERYRDNNKNCFFLGGRGVEGGRPGEFVIHTDIPTDETKR
jgi:hypothetical protein